MTPDLHAISPALTEVTEARGANLAEQQLIYNRTVEVDSLVEKIHTLGIPDPARRELLDYCRRIFKINRVEGEHERQAAGILDHAVVRLRDETLNHNLRSLLTVKAIARTLRPALAVIAKPADHDAIAFVKSVRAVDDLIAEAGAQRLLTASVAHELGPGRYRLLQQLVAERVAV